MSVPSREILNSLRFPNDLCSRVLLPIYEQALQNCLASRSIRSNEVAFLHSSFNISGSTNSWWCNQFYPFL